MLKVLVTLGQRPKFLKTLRQILKSYRALDKMAMVIMPLVYIQKDQEVPPKEPGFLEHFEMMVLVLQTQGQMIMSV